MRLIAQRGKNSQRAGTEKNSGIIMPWMLWVRREPKGGVRNSTGHAEIHMDQYEKAWGVGKADG